MFLACHVQPHAASDEGQNALGCCHLCGPSLLARVMQAVCMRLSYVCYVHVLSIRSECVDGIATSGFRYYNSCSRVSQGQSALKFVLVDWVTRSDKLMMQQETLLTNG